jgi:hypothetical protein
MLSWSTLIPNRQSGDGPERGIEILSSRQYPIEPYRGDAKNVMRVTSSILARLYGTPSGS